MAEKTLDLKYNALKEILAGLKRVLVAYSGGTDSSLLVYAAKVLLGYDNVLAVTADSETYTKDELAYTKSFTSQYNIRHLIITTCELDVINRRGNPHNRCYYCKRELFSVLNELAAKEQAVVVEGSNLDDEKDYRPGAKARDELGIRSPLKEAGFTKTEIRMLSRELELPTWDKPAYACLTSRFPYNVQITKPALAMVEAAEQYLHSLRFLQCRVRHYGKKARIEVARELVAKALDMQAEIAAAFYTIGYTEVEIDPEGYRMGNMNAL